jgi:AcrR family transcriptional regulator
VDKRAAAPVGLRERNKQEKLERIRRAARALFARKGFDNTTTREIAERAGVGAGTLFLYARDKEELLFLIFREDIERVGEEAFATRPRGATLVDSLAHVFGRYFDYYAENPELSRVFLKELLFQGREDRLEMTILTLRFLERMAELVGGAQEQGELRADFSPLIAASNFFALYCLSLLLWLGGTSDRSTQEMLLRGALELQIRGLQ